MACTSPRDVGFKSDGKTLSWSPKTHDKAYMTFKIACGKCIECRLAYASQWAARCVDEAKMHPKNCFITLTYSDENLGINKLYYRDFQLFIKRLRDRIGPLPEEKICYVVCGEYGARSKRKHWHAIIFNWQPEDLKYKYSNDRGDKVYSSEVLDSLWGKGISEVGSVTFESAGYVARYSAKKLVHGQDQSHDFKPVFKVSSKHAIGKKWLEKFWPDVFNYGQKVLNGRNLAIPRYYEKWLKKHKPTEYCRYMTDVKETQKRKASLREAELERELQNVRSARGLRAYSARSVNSMRREINKQKHKQALDKLKL